MTMCPEKSPKEGMPAPKVNVAKILQWLHHMYKMNNHSHPNEWISTYNDEKWKST